ncbi:helix-turn-helix transcriptional regulator [Arthrobacter sp. ISL-65]|uniref:helix-turn-helix transcriptional regulator n=1 Tax=Arthrobacter sp. ISL-65 TaxID=2819112 RepID=UPI001BE5BD02|nr:helix-turn-helix transcriptional regulator [Arthrobacter sp. ISL-65]MBT2548886.1 helix-turn-helix domain-containing protein [Arthrobacter sp. ISL-65]
MDNRNEVRDFLTSRRAKLTPAQAGLPDGGNRRVAGLRRGEVAMLADTSIEYYSKIERGNLAGVSDSVLDAVARALQLDEAEREHLFDLARAANGAAIAVPRRKPKQWAARPGLQLALDAITASPAFVRNGRMDILAVNPFGSAFYDEVLDGPGRGNLARYNFLDERSHVFYPDWDAAADISVSILRTEAGRDPRDKQLHDLIGELSTRSNEFRTRWGAHNVRRHGSGTKNFHHHVVGKLTLSYEGLELTAEPGLSFLIYTAEPGSPSHERLQLLASWAATQQASTDESTTRHRDATANTETSATSSAAASTQEKY